MVTLMESNYMFSKMFTNFQLHVIEKWEQPNYDCFQDF